MPKRSLQWEDIEVEDDLTPKRTVKPNKLRWEDIAVEDDLTDEQPAPVPAAAAPPEPEEDFGEKFTRILKAAPRHLAMGVDAVGMEVGQLLDFLGADETGKNVKDLFKKRMEATAKELDPITQKIDSTPIYDKGNWDFSHIGEKALSGALQSLPDMVLAIAPSTVALRGLMKLKTAERIAKGAMKLGASEKSAQYIGEFLERGLAGSGIEGLQAGLGNAAQTEAEIRNTPIDKLRDLPSYQEAYASLEGTPEGEREDAARSLLASKAATRIFLQTVPSTGGIGLLTGGGATGMVSSKLAGKVAAREAGKAARTGAIGFLKNVGEGFVEEAGQEALQSPAEQLIQNAAEQKYKDKDIDLLDGVAESSVEGALSGGLLGVAGGGASHAVDAVKRALDPAQALRRAYPEIFAAADQAMQRVQEQQAQEAAAAQQTPAPSAPETEAQPAPEAAQEVAPFPEEPAPVAEAGPAEQAPEPAMGNPVAEQNQAVAQPMGQPIPEPEQPQAPPEPDPVQIPDNVVFQNPDGSTTTIAVKPNTNTDGPPTYAVRVTRKEANGNSTAKGSLYSGADTLKLIESLRPAPEEVAAAEQQQAAVEQQQAAVEAANKPPTPEEVQQHVDEPILQAAHDKAEKGERVTIAWVQRQFRTGYNHAARIMEQLRKDGVIDKDGMAVKPEAPEAPAPQAEAPKVEAPKVETPKAEKQKKNRDALKKKREETPAAPVEPEPEPTPAPEATKAEKQKAKREALKKQKQEEHDQQFKEDFTAALGKVDESKTPVEEEAPAVDRAWTFTYKYRDEKGKVSEETYAGEVTAPDRATAVKKAEQIVRDEGAMWRTVGATVKEKTEEAPAAETEGGAVRASNGEVIYPHQREKVKQLEERYGDVETAMNDLGIDVVANSLTVPMDVESINRVVEGVHELDAPAPETKAEKQKKKREALKQKKEDEQAELERLKAELAAKEAAKPTSKNRKEGTKSPAGEANASEPVSSPAPEEKPASKAEQQKANREALKQPAEPDYPTQYERYRGIEKIAGSAMLGDHATAVQAEVDRGTFTRAEADRLYEAVLDHYNEHTEKPTVAAIAAAAQIPHVMTKGKKQVGVAVKKDRATLAAEASERAAKKKKEKAAKPEGEKETAKEKKERAARVEAAGAVPATIVVARPPGETKVGASLRFPNGETRWLLVTPKRDVYWGKEGEGKYATFQNAHEARKTAEMVPQNVTEPAKPKPHVGEEAADTYDLTAGEEEESATEDATEEEDTEEEESNAPEEPAEEPLDTTDVDLSGINLDDLPSFEGPEMAELFSRLSGGKLARVLARMRRPGVLGQFSPQTGKINLWAAIGKNPKLLLRVFAHEMGHWVDWFPDSDIKRGNILGSLAALHNYAKTLLPNRPNAPGMLTDKDRARLRREAERELKKLAGPEVSVEDWIEKVIPKFQYLGITPEMVKAIWDDVNARDKYPKLYQAIAQMDEKTKKAVAVQAMKGIVHDLLQKFGERVQVGEEIVKEKVKRVIKPAVEVTKEEIAKLYKKKLEDEILKRDLFKEETILQELKDLTMHWKPFDPTLDMYYTKYRLDPRELYADAISVLLNKPALLKKMAPTFYKAFFNWIGRKGEMGNIYADLVQRIGNPELTKDYRNHVLEGDFAEAERLQKIAQTPKKHSLWVQFLRNFFDKNIVLRRYVKKANERRLAEGKRTIEDYDNPAFWVEELPYISSQAAAFHADLWQKVMQPLDKAGLTLDHIGDYMTYARIAYGDRKELINPHLHTVQTAQDQLDRMKQVLGDEKFAALENIASSVFDVWLNHIVTTAEKSHLFSPQLIEIMKTNKHYATFQYLRFIERQYGKGATAHVYKQFGGMGAIRNPFIAMVMKGTSIIRASNVKMAIKSTTDFLTNEFEAENRNPDTAEIRKLRKGDYTYITRILPNGKKLTQRVAKEPKDSQNWALLQYPHDGQIVAHYVPRDIAEIFNNDPYTSRLVTTFLSHPIVKGSLRGLRAVLVTHNPLWMAANVPKDLLATWKQIPDMSFLDVLKYYAKAYSEAKADAFGDTMPETVKKALKEKALIPDRQYKDWDDTADDEITRSLQHFGFQTPEQHRLKVWRPVMKVWETLGNMGKFTERWGKLAGYMYLDDTAHHKYAQTVGTLGERRRMAIAHQVRGQVATPDSQKGGVLLPVLNNIRLFSGIAIRGWESSWEGATSKRGKDLRTGFYLTGNGRFAPSEGRRFKSSYLFKTVMVNVLPKLAMMAIGMGALGAGYEKLMDQIGEYSKTNYITFPLGSVNGRTVALRIPQDYTGQAIGGLLWMLAHGRVFGPRGAISYVNENLPGSTNPFIEVSKNLLLAVTGRNPWDEYRGRNVIPERAFEAKDHRMWAALAKDSWNKLGGAMIYKAPPPSAILNTDESVLEKVLRYPVINGISRFITIDDVGIREMNKEVADQEKMKAARRYLDTREAIADSINALDGKKPTKSDAIKLFMQLKKEQVLPIDAKPRSFISTYERYASGYEHNAYIDAIAMAATTAEKAELMISYKKRMSAEAYNDFRKKVISEGLLPKGAIKEQVKREIGLHK